MFSDSAFLSIPGPDIPLLLVCFHLLRHHSRKSRQRKKVFVETLKQEVAELTVYKLMVEEAGDMVSMHRAEDKVSPRGNGRDFKIGNDCLICF